jgi:hypothetical protein
MKLIPVMFPPGRARLATIPNLNRIANPKHDDGGRRSGLLGGKDRRRSDRYDDVNLETDQLGRHVRKPVQLPLRPSVLNGDVLVLNPTELAQPSLERLLRTWDWGTARQETDPVDFPRLLRVGCERRREDTKGEHDDCDCFAAHGGPPPFSP